MFKDAHAAIKFAFRTLNKQIVKTSSINSMRGPSWGGMKPQELHAQAAMIMSKIERVVDVHGQAYLRAQYGREHEYGEHSRAIMNHLAKMTIATFPTGMHSQRGVEKLIINYFGGSIGMSAIRCDMKCGSVRVNQYRDMVKAALDGVGERAERDVDIALRESGLIEAID